MSKSGEFLDYRGPLDFNVIDSVLDRLKKTSEYNQLNKITAKRVYALVVECLENICQHSELKLTKNPDMQSHITVSKVNGKIVINSGNTVTGSEMDILSNRIDHINSLNSTTLQILYEDKLKSDFPKNVKCAGLGFIFMALKSGNKLSYSFTPLNNGYSYFELQVTLNQYVMRKLIIEPRSNSPKVLLDPEKKIYLISGESRPPDVREFYEPVISWLGEFGSAILKSPDRREPVFFNFNFEYFNSSSGKLILDISKILAELHSKGVNITINWHSEKDDYDMLEAGKEISRIVKFPFQFIEADKE
jgi:hypothetical protein